MVKFFDIARQLNDKAPDPLVPLLGFEMIRGMFISSIRGDTDLVNCFTTLPKPTGHAVCVQDTEKMKFYFLNKAALYDGKDDSGKLDDGSIFKASKKDTMKVLVHGYDIDEDEADALADYYDG